MVVRTSVLNRNGILWRAAAWYWARLSPQVDNIAIFDVHSGTVSGTRYRIVLCLHVFIVDVNHDGISIVIVSIVSRAPIIPKIFFVITVICFGEDRLVPGVLLLTRLVCV